VSFIPKYALGNIHLNNTYESNWLSFSFQKGIGPQIDELTLTQQYCALHKETVLPANRVEQGDYQRPVELLKKVLINQGIRWKKTNRIVWTYQHYGVCDPSIHSNRLLSYSKLAQEYLYSQVSGLMEVNLEWSMLPKHHTKSFINTKEYRGLVGKHTYLVYRVNGVNEEGIQIQPGLVNIAPVERAINYIIDDTYHKPIGSTIFVIHGPTSLISPFTEIIHLTTHQPTLRLTGELVTSLGKDHAQRMGRVYGESITEAAGSLLALNFLQKYGNTEEKNTVRAVSQNINNQYPLVQAAMAYMNQNGVERVLGAYSENPGEVVKKIKKMAVN
jgi:hypothetical protein